MAVRRQATLYLPETQQDCVEAIRSRFNPEQARLIGAHVTLCREDEVPDWEQLQTRLLKIDRIAVDLTFNEIVRDGDLVYAAASKSTSSFDRLRNTLLDSDSTRPRLHRPHLTLIHPRNGKCDDRTYMKVECMFKPFSAVFDRVTIIEQIDSGRWQNLVEHP